MGLSTSSLFCAPSSFKILHFSLFRKAKLFILASSFEIDQRNHNKQNTDLILFNIAYNVMFMTCPFSLIFLSTLESFQNELMPKGHIHSWSDTTLYIPALSETLTVRIDLCLRLRKLGFCAAAIRDTLPPVEP